MEKLGTEYATTEMDTVAADEVLPLESVTVAVKVIVPELLRKPVVKLDEVLE